MKKNYFNITSKRIKQKFANNIKKFYKHFRATIYSTQRKDSVDFVIIFDCFQNQFKRERERQKKMTY